MKSCAHELYISYIVKFLYDDDKQWFCTILFFGGQQEKKIFVQWIKIGHIYILWMVNLNE